MSSDDEDDTSTTRVVDPTPSLLASAIFPQPFTLLTTEIEHYDAINVDVENGIKKASVQKKKRWLIRSCSISCSMTWR